MRCKKCECWNQGIPSDYSSQAKAAGFIVTDKEIGFCDLVDDVMFADEGCNATKIEKEKRAKLNDLVFLHTRN